MFQEAKEATTNALFAPVIGARRINEIDSQVESPVQDVFRPRFFRAMARGSVSKSPVLLNL